MNAINRKQFLRGDFTGRRTPRRPPWAIGEELFTDLCTGCRDCMTACVKSILTHASGGYPAVDFSRGECTFCGACARVCRTGALQTPSPDAPAGAPWGLKANLTARCLALTGVYCRSCGDACEAGAIRFSLHGDGTARPKFDPDLCTGCGACYAPCPVQGIEIVDSRKSAAVGASLARHTGARS